MSIVNLDYADGNENGNVPEEEVEIETEGAVVEKLAKIIHPDDDDKPEEERTNNVEQLSLFGLFAIGFQSLVHQLIPWEGCNSCQLSDEEVDSLAVFQLLDVRDAAVNENFPEWQVLLGDEDDICWERRCKSLLRTSAFNSPLISQLDTYRGKLRAYLGSWSSEKSDCSTNIYILDDQLTAHRIPVVNHTDAIRGKLGFNRGAHAWDVRVVGSLGTHFSIGIATSKAKLTTTAGYVSLIGDDCHSWGWDLVWGNVSHKGKIISQYPHKFSYEYTPGDIIRITLDCEKATLAFSVNDVSCGDAFVNLPRKTFYPSVALVYGNMHVSLVYLGVPPPPLPQMELA